MLDYLLTTTNNIVVLWATNTLQSVRQVGAKAYAERSS